VTACLQEACNFTYKAKCAALCLQPVSNNIAPWSEQTSKRIDVSDYRSAGRISEAKKEVSECLHVD